MKTVVICGSRKFKSDIEKWTKKLLKASVTVYAPDFDADHSEWDNISKE